MIVTIIENVTFCKTRHNNLNFYQYQFVRDKFDVLIF